MASQHYNPLYKVYFLVFQHICYNLKSALPQLKPSLNGVLVLWRKMSSSTNIINAWQASAATDFLLMLVFLQNQSFRANINWFVNSRSLQNVGISLWKSKKSQHLHSHQSEFWQNIEFMLVHWINNLWRANIYKFAIRFSHHHVGWSEVRCTPFSGQLKIKFDRKIALC